MILGKDMGEYAHLKDAGPKDHPGLALRPSTRSAAPANRNVYLAVFKRLRIWSRDLCAATRA